MGFAAMVFCRRLLLQFCFSFFLIFPVIASEEIQEIHRDQALGKTVAKIVILGLQRTQSNVVHRELLIEEGKPLQLLALEEINECLHQKIIGSS